MPLLLFSNVSDFSRNPFSVVFRTKWGYYVKREK